MDLSATYRQGALNKEVEKPLGADQEATVVSIVYAHRYLEAADRPLDGQHRIGRNAIELLLQREIDGFVEDDLPHALGTIYVLAFRGELADRLLAGKMLDTAYRQTVCITRADDAGLFHGSWRRLIADPALHERSTKLLHGLIDHMECLLEEYGRADLSPFLAELYEIQVHPLDLTKADGTTSVLAQMKWDIDLPSVVTSSSPNIVKCP